MFGTHEDNIYYTSRSLAGFVPGVKEPGRSPGQDGKAQGDLGSLPSTRQGEEDGAEVDRITFAASLRGGFFFAGQHTFLLIMAGMIFEEMQNS